MISDEYLGDGVYASFDGYHIVLDLRAQDSTTRIALEPRVMRLLKEFEQRCLAAVEARHQQQSREESEAEDGE